MNDLIQIKEDNPDAMGNTVKALLGDELHHLELVTSTDQTTIMLVPLFNDED